MAEPTPYDLEQDARIETIESLITAEYEPPEGVEYSYPVANQGITQEQFRLMNLGQANGVIHGDNGVVNDNPNSTGYRYYLDGHSSDSETNQRNTLILRAGTSAEAIVEGFYHRLTEDMELPFPPVTTTTVYRVTLTYDPRKFKTSPVNIEVWDGEPPTAYGQVQVLLHTVERRPNQLLSQATTTRYRPYTAGVVSVQNPSQLPDPRSYPAGTLAVPSATGRGVYVRSNGAGEWRNTSVSAWEGVGKRNGWLISAPPVRVRRTTLGIQLSGRLNGENANNSRYIAQLPAGMEPNVTRLITATGYGSTTTSGMSPRLDIEPDGGIHLREQADRVGIISFDGIIIPE